MENIINHIEILLPLTLLTLAFFLKLSIDRSVEVPNLIQAICELPVDIMFLSISFLGAYSISKPREPEGLFFTVAFIVLSIIVVVLWRKSLRYYDLKKWYWIIFLAINLFIAITSLFTSVDVLLKENFAKNEKVENNIIDNGNK